MRSTRSGIVFCLLLLLLVLGGGAGTGLEAQETVRQYVVKLQGEPVVGRMRRLKGNLPRRLSLKESDAAAYRTQLRARQADLMRLLAAIPQAKVSAQFDTVYNGLAVTLRPEDVARVEQLPGVEKVIPSIRYRKALDAALSLVRAPAAWASPVIGGEKEAGAGIKIGIVDTGIDITHPMFQDSELVVPVGFPLFTPSTPLCPAADQLFTNSKVIVARNYVSLLANPDQNCDARDRDGHGSFVAAIAAGRRVQAPLASIAGAAPKAFLGNYKVFGTPGSNDEATLGAIMQAIDDAAKDGMDVINLSLGALANGVPENDPLSQAVQTAVNAGVVVVVAAGNEGPGTGTVTSPGISPAAITVGAASNSRTFGNSLSISAAPPDLQNVAAVPGNGPAITATVGPAPLVDVASVSGSDTACSPLPEKSLMGSLALIRRGNCNFSVKIRNAFLAGAIGAILFNNQFNQPPILMDVEDSRQIPSAMIGNANGRGLQQFLTGAGTPVEASLGAEQAAVPVVPNRLSDFSAEGPSTDFGIKPDLVVPGAEIYSATQSNFPAGEQFDETGFDLSGGTSFSSPLVAGAAALIRQAFPAFTPAQVKSALVGTARNVVSSTLGGNAGVLSRGNGLMDLEAALGTIATVTPSSISLGAREPGSALGAIFSLTVTNVGSAAETFSVSVTTVVGSSSMMISASPAVFSLDAGAVQDLTVTATSAEPLNGNFEGFLTIAGQGSSAAVTVPYWGTFLRPSINSGGVVNGASFVSGPTTVAAGGIVSIFGEQMTNSTETTPITPLPIALGGATLTIGGFAAPFFFASPNQINAQVPVELVGKSFTDVVLHLNGRDSTPRTVQLSSAAPGIFTIAQSGEGRGAILHAADSSPVTPENPVLPGEFISVFATGLGATTPAATTGEAALVTPLSTTRITPSATVGGISAVISFSGLAPTFVGLYQVNLRVPDNVPPGDQPLLMTVGGTSSNTVLLPVGP